MSTARERYEAKTKVVTFRVSNELYEELEDIREDADLSFADLIKLGAGIAREEIDEKLDEIDELKDKIDELRETVKTEQKQLDYYKETAQKEMMNNLEKQYKIYTLFDVGYSTDEVRFKLKLGSSEVFKHFKEWTELRGERKKLQIELLRKCLNNYLVSVRENIRYRLSGRRAEEAKQYLDYYQAKLADPSKLTKNEKTFLINNYSYFL